jgi:hypothetical protein
MSGPSEPRTTEPCVMASGQYIPIRYPNQPRTRARHPGLHRGSLARGVQHRSACSVRLVYHP